MLSCFKKNGWWLLRNGPRGAWCHRGPGSNVCGRDQSTWHEGVDSVLLIYKHIREISIAAVVFTVVGSFFGVCGLHLLLNIGIKADVDKATSDIKQSFRKLESEIKTDFENFETDLGALKADVGAFKEDVGALKEDIKQDFVRLQNGIKEDFGKIEMQMERLVQVWSRKVEAQDTDCSPEQSDCGSGQSD
jgi:gas vesicle protein